MHLVYLQKTTSFKPFYLITLPTFDSKFTIPPIKYYILLVYSSKYMKKIALLLTVLLINTIGFSQDKKVEIDLAKNEYIINQVFLENNGFVIQLGSLFDGRERESRLQYYDGSCNLIWEAPIKDRHKKNSKTYLVASPSGSFIYYIEIKGDVYSPEDQYITQITKQGVTKNFEIKGKEEFGKNLQTIFCDDDFLYYLTTEDGNELNDKKKTTEKLILNRFSSASLTHKKIIVNVPAIVNGETTTFWSFLGQKEGEKMLHSKIIDNKSGICRFSIVEFNQEGEIGKAFNINLDLEDKFLRPAYRVKIPKNIHENLTDVDFEKKLVSTATSDNSSRYYYEKNYLLIGGFSHLTFDPTNKAFYAFCLFGDKPFKNVGAQYEGFYIFKYDLEGKKLWSLKQKVSQDLLDERIFSKTGAPGDREISLKILPDQSLNFTIHFKTTLFTHEISSDGKFLASRRKDKHLAPTDYTVFTSSKKLLSEEYIKKNFAEKNKQHSIGNIISEMGEIILVHDGKGSKLSLLYFNNKL